MVTANDLAQRLQSEPPSFARTLRPDNVRTVTSGKAGYAIPLAIIPLLREDALETTRVMARAYMDETVDLLINTVHCVFSAYFVPKLAFDRFGGSMDALNRSYMGQPEMDGSQINWFGSQIAHDGGVYRPFYRALGAHAMSGTENVCSDYFQAYQKIFEYRCRQRSEALWESVGAVDSGQLAPAFFDNPQMAIVKPSFDDAMIDGQIPLTVVNGKMPVKSTSRADAIQPSNPGNYQAVPATPLGSAPGGSEGLWEWASDIWAELEQDGITVSVSNIDLARETAAWAKVRARYSGLDDDELVDLLMSGVRVPTQYQRMPMLLARQKVPFGMTQRYSTEADKLDISATRGVAGAEMTLRAPQTNTGGFVVIIAEVVPEQFWERSQDYWLSQTTADRSKLPDRLLDQLDPQAVEVVENAHADVAHSDPEGIFGYAPLNHKYVRRRFNLGGKFHKPDPEAPWSEDRNRIWGSEPVDPTLSKEFFLATDLPDEIFMSGKTEDNFEFSLVADARISGLTYIGPLLREQTGEYEAILERVDLNRISGTPVDALDDGDTDDVIEGDAEDGPEDEATATEQENEE